MSVERNDVNISRLFMWGREFEIEGNNEEKVKVFIRLVGDADLNRARVYALRCSSTLRGKLKDKTSDEHAAYIPEIDSVEKDVLVEALVSMTIREYAQEAVKEVDIPYPVEPASDAKLEKQEQYQAKVDAYPAKREKEIEKYITKKTDARRIELLELEREVLFGLYEGLIISELCETEMIRKFKEFCTYSGVFIDEKYTEKLFSSLEEFQNLPFEMKEKFLIAYRELEIEQDELKK